MEKEAIPHRWEYREPDDYMVGFIPDLTYENVTSWIHPDNLSKREKRKFREFTLWSAVDGNKISGREVSLGRIEGPSDEGQHIHENSDTFVIVVGGKALLLMEDVANEISAPKLIRVPKGTPHGFRLPEGGYFEFLSVQAPPIRDPITGVEDFHETNPDRDASGDR